MSHVEVPLAQVRQELEKLGFRDLPEHLLVSFMQSILNEEAVATAMSGPCMNAPSDINEAKETNFLRSNGAISTQSASATFAAAALKTRVSGRKVTILSPSKCAHSAFRQSETQEDQRSLPLGQLQQRDAVCQEQQRKPNTTVVEERRTSSDHTLQSGVQGSSKSRHGVHQKSGQEPQIHTVPSAHIPQSESASSAASNISSPPHFFSDENSVPASERLEAANNALRAAISCKSSSLRAHSSSSSVIFASTGLTRPRSKHDPVKAFQNHSAEWASTPHSRLSYVGPGVAQRSAVVQPSQPSLPPTIYEVQPHVTPRSRPTLPSSYVPPPNRRRDEVIWATRVAMAQPPRW